MRYWLLAAWALVSLGCTIENDGLTPPLGEFNSPIALALVQTDPAEAPSHLIVANSDFDLAYNGGTIQAVDLAAVEDLLPDDCQDCVVADAADAIVGEVKTGSHAFDVAVSPDGLRVYASIRGDVNLTTMNFDPATGKLACGGEVWCSDKFRKVDDSRARDNAAFKGEPLVVSAGSLGDDFGVAGGGDYILVAHRTGRISLLVDRVSGAAPADPLKDSRRPQLVDVLTGLPSQLASIRFDPAANNGWGTNSASRSVIRFGLAIDPSEGGLFESYVFQSSTAFLSGVNDGVDTRDVLFGPLADGRSGAFLLSRRPESVLVVDERPSPTGRLSIVRAIDIGFGASKLDTIEVSIGAQKRTLLLASCFTSRDIYVVDPVAGRILSVIRGFNGPYDMAFDASRKRLYVTDFSASVIRVVLMEPLIDCLESGANDEGVCSKMLGQIGTDAIVGDLL